MPFRAAVAAAAAAVLAIAAPGFAQSVNVTLNGAPLNLTPAPITRAGRVFVPLRGIFESLGASVVYQNRQINAQGNNRAVALSIGSTQATVNGQPQNLDVAPFVVGASTYVPLRFVSQALGATVNFDGANKIVALSNGGAANTAAAPAPARSAAIALQVSRTQPGRGATVAARRPTIEAQFNGAQADPNSLRITLDDLDVTSSTSRSPSGFVYSPPSDLQSMRHRVAVTGHDTAGTPFEAKWDFTSGTSATENTLSNVSPQDGAQVGTQFTVSGRTLPGATVVVQVGAADTSRTTVAGAVGTILGLSGGTNVRNAVTANGDGSFSSVVQINAPPSTTLKLVVTSTDPRTQAAARPISRTLTVQ